MKSKLSLIVILLLSVFIFSGSSIKQKKKIPDSVQRYIDRFKKVAQAEHRKFGIPASITIAQGILESRSGESRLTKKTNNHFGIKYYRGCGYKKSYMMADDKPNDRFIIYPNNWYSFRHHSEFLMTKRYKKCRQCGNNYKCWSINLKRCGYATSKKYSRDLIKIIEDYQLYKLDK